LQSLRIDRTASFRSLFTNGGVGLDAPMPAVSLVGPQGWSLDIHAGGRASLFLANTHGFIVPDVVLSGSFAHPAISGSINVKGLSLDQQRWNLDIWESINISDATFFLNPADPASTALVMHISGFAYTPYLDGWLYGTLADKHFTWPPEVTAWLAAVVDLMAPSPFKPLPDFSVKTNVAPPQRAAVWPAPGSP
jgi:hypothetical protein